MLEPPKGDCVAGAVVAKALLPPKILDPPKGDWVGAEVAAGAVVPPKIEPIGFGPPGMKGVLDSSGIKLIKSTWKLKQVALERALK
jgi:hypothetical protein